MLSDTWDSIQSLLGLGQDTLDPGEMALRALLTFAITVVIVRFGAKRLFGKGTAFDYIVAIMIGSVMSRAINGSADLFATWMAGAVLVGLHWLLAYLTARLDWFGPLVKGNPVDLIRDGTVLEDGMRAANLSRNDLDQALREQGDSDPSNVRRAVLERDGSISVIAKKSEPQVPQVLEVIVEDGVQTVRISVE